MITAILIVGLILYFMGKSFMKHKREDSITLGKEGHQISFTIRGLPMYLAGNYIIWTGTGLLFLSYLPYLWAYGIGTLFVLLMFTSAIRCKITDKDLDISK